MIKKNLFCLISETNIYLKKSSYKESKLIFRKIRVLKKNQNTDYHCFKVFFVVRKIIKINTPQIYKFKV